MASKAAKVVACIRLFKGSISSFAAP